MRKPDITKFTTKQGREIWKITFKARARIMGRVTTFPVHIRQGIWKGDPVDFCSYTTHAGSEAWAKILAKAWQDWLKGASKCGMLTYDLSEHE